MSLARQGTSPRTTLILNSYDGDDTANDAPAPVVKPEVDPQDAADAAAAAADDFLSQQQAEPVTETNESNGFKQEQSYDQDMGGQQNEFREPEPDNRPLIGSKEDGYVLFFSLYHFCAGVSDSSST